MSCQPKSTSWLSLATVSIHLWIHPTNLIHLWCFQSHCQVSPPEKRWSAVSGKHCNMNHIIPHSWQCSPQYRRLDQCRVTIYDIHVCWLKKLEKVRPAFLRPPRKESVLSLEVRHTKLRKKPSDCKGVSWFFRMPTLNHLDVSEFVAGVIILQFVSSIGHPEQVFKARHCENRRWSNARPSPHQFVGWKRNGISCQIIWWQGWLQDDRDGLNPFSEGCLNKFLKLTKHPRNFTSRGGISNDPLSQRPINWPTRPHLTHQSLMLTMQKISQYTVVSGLGPTSQKKLKLNDKHYKIICNIHWVVPLPSNSQSPPRLHTIFLVGDPHKPAVAPVTGRGDNPNYTISIK